jgi:hypothetical protein
MDYFALKNAGNTNLRGISDDQNSTLFSKIDGSYRTLWRVNKTRNA